MQTRCWYRAIREGKDVSNFPLFTHPDFSRISYNSATVARIIDRIKTNESNKQIEAENAEIIKMREEAQKLEEELKKLESGGNGG